MRVCLLFICFALSLSCSPPSSLITTRSRARQNLYSKIIENALLIVIGRRRMGVIYNCAICFKISHGLLPRKGFNEFVIYSQKLVKKREWWWCCAAAQTEQHTVDVVVDAMGCAAVLKIAHKQFSMHLIKQSRLGWWRGHPWWVHFSDLTHELIFVCIFGTCL